MPTIEQRLAALEQAMVVRAAGEDPAIAALRSDMTASFGRVAMAQAQDREEIMEMLRQAKEERAEMEKKILGAFQQLIVVVTGKGDA